MWYVIEGYDGTDVLAARLSARPAHLARRIPPHLVSRSPSVRL